MSSLFQLEAETTWQVFTPYLTVPLHSMEAVRGTMRPMYLHSNVFSMSSRGLEQPSFGTGEWVMG